MHAQSNPRAAWPSHDDNGGFFLVVTLLGLAVLSVVLWINFHGVISASVMDVFHREIGWLRPMTDRFNLADRQMMATNPEDVRPKDLLHRARRRDRNPYPCRLRHTGACRHLHGLRCAVALQARVRYGRAHR
jgi:hypothetical protein